MISLAIIGLIALLFVIVSGAGAHFYFSRCERYQDKIFKNYGVLKKISDTTDSACCAEAQKVPGSTHYSFNKDNNGCSIKKGAVTADHLVDKPNRITGVVRRIPWPSFFTK